MNEREPCFEKMFIFFTTFYFVYVLKKLFMKNMTSLELRDNLRN